MTEYGKPWRDRPVLSVGWLHRRRLQGDPDWDSFMKDFSVIDERGYPRWRTFEEAQSFMLTPAFHGIDFGCIHEEPLAYYLGAIMDASLQMEEGYHGEYVDRFLSYLGEPHSKRVMRLLSPAERDSVRQWMADWRRDNPDTHTSSERILRLWIGQSMEGLEEPDKEFWNWDMETEPKVPAEFLGTWFNGDWSRGDRGERITLNPDWTFERYVRFDPDSTAVGRFALKGKSELVITPQYYAVDAQRSGGSSPQEFTFAKRSRTTCLIRNGIVYWREGIPPKGL
ncbi:MAG: hypothetical protein K1X67_11055 [Fimbriimonadaceae bacterium]|nr:hypothetical protein [Fimbriimonadaceae bacterium]